MIREKQKQVEAEAAHQDRRGVEMKHRLYELDKEMQTL